MSIIKKPNEKYTVDVVNEYVKRIQRTFTQKSEADAFESSIVRIKYERKLVTNKLMNARYSLLYSIDEYLKAKQHLRPKSIQKYKAVMDFFRDFISANNIKYLNEFSPTDEEKFYNILTAEREIDKGNHKITIKASVKPLTSIWLRLRNCLNGKSLKTILLKAPSHILRI